MRSRAGVGRLRRYYQFAVPCYRLREREQSASAMSGERTPRAFILAWARSAAGPTSHIRTCGAERSLASAGLFGIRQGRSSATFQVGPHLGPLVHVLLVITRPAARAHRNHVVVTEFAVAWNRCLRQSRSSRSSRRQVCARLMLATMPAVSIVSCPCTSRCASRVALGEIRCRPILAMSLGSTPTISGPWNLAVGVVDRFHDQHDRDERVFGPADEALGCAV